MCCWTTWSWHCGDHSPCQGPCPLLHYLLFIRRVLENWHRSDRRPAWGWTCRVQDGGGLGLPRNVRGRGATPGWLPAGPSVALGPLLCCSQAPRAAAPDTPVTAARVPAGPCLADTGWRPAHARERRRRQDAAMAENPNPADASGINAGSLSILPWRSAAARGGRQGSVGEPVFLSPASSRLEGSARRREKTRVAVALLPACGSFGSGGQSLLFQAWRQGPWSPSPGRARGCGSTPPGPCEQDTALPGTGRDWRGPSLREAVPGGGGALPCVPRG